MDNRLKIAAALAALLDRRYKVFNVRFGIDPILNMIPVIGDVLGVILGLFIVYTAVKMNLPQRKISQMVRNIVIDFFIGIVPVVGSIADVFYRSNLKNMQIIHDHFGKKSEEGIIIKHN